jgi:hypothetical protein
MRGSGRGEFRKWSGVGCLAALLISSACGPSEPGLCEDTREGALTPWINSEWEPYCNVLYDHLEEPGNYTMLELTEFFAEHPQRREELSIALQRYKNPEQCFQEPAEQLRYRSLVSCLDNEEAMERRISASWTARSEPWLEEYQTRVKRLRQRITDASRLKDKVVTKLEQRFDFVAPMEPDAYEKLAGKLVAIREDMAFLDTAEPEYRSFLKVSAEADELNALVDRTLSEPVEIMLEDHQKNRVNFAKLNFEENFLRYAVYSVGKPCPDGESRASKEEKGARSALALKFSEMGAPRSDVRITEKITIAENENGDMTQSTSGLFCAPRASERQFDGRKQQCGVFTFTVQRVKLAGERRYGDWTLTRLDESEYDNGVDCSLLEK